MYDEKYVLSGKAVNPKSPQTWLHDLRDYLAGRSADLDKILRAEQQPTEIPMAPGQGLGSFPMPDQCPVEPREISRQFWAFLGPLVASGAGKDGTFPIRRHPI